MTQPKSILSDRQADKLRADKLRADKLHEKLQPKDAPTPKASRGLGAKEEQMNKQQSSNEKGSDSPGG
jgi:hypothetical protein